MPLPKSLLPLPNCPTARSSRVYGLVLSLTQEVSTADWSNILTLSLKSRLTDWQFLVISEWRTVGAMVLLQNCWFIANQWTWPNASTKLIVFVTLLFNQLFKELGDPLMDKNRDGRRKKRSKKKKTVDWLSVDACLKGSVRIKCVIKPLDIMELLGLSRQELGTSNCWNHWQFPSSLFHPFTFYVHATIFTSSLLGTTPLGIILPSFVSKPSITSLAFYFLRIGSWYHWSVNGRLWEETEPQYQSANIQIKPQSSH